MLIAHGSRAKESGEAFRAFARQFQTLYPKRRVVGAFLDLEKPDVPEALEICAADKVHEIVIVPLMLFPGRHVKTDIPVLISKFNAGHPEIAIHYAGPLADNKILLRLVCSQAGRTPVRKLKRAGRKSDAVPGI